MINLSHVDIRGTRSGKEQKISFEPPIKFDDDKQVAEFIDRVEWIMNYMFMEKCDYTPECEYIP